MNVLGKTLTGKDSFKLDSVVVVSNGEGGDTAYVIECAKAPQISKVMKLLKKTALFEKSPEAKTPPFLNCKSFIPVLGGRLISKAVLSRCHAERIGHVTVSGAGFEYHRSLCPCARYALKLITK